MQGFFLVTTLIATIAISVFVNALWPNIIYILVKSVRRSKNPEGKKPSPRHPAVWIGFLFSLIVLIYSSMTAAQFSRPTPSTVQRGLAYEATLRSTNSAQIISPSSITYTSLSTQGWQDTGVRVNAGDIVSMEYVAGLWAWTLDRPHFGAIGDPRTSNTCGNVCDQVAPGVTPAGIYCPKYDIRIGALIGKVGNNQIFYIGNSMAYTVPLDTGQAQTLFMRMNDCDSGLYDNDGSIQVNIDVSK